MSIENFFIEYAKIRQKDIELEFSAIKAARPARSNKLKPWYNMALGKLGCMLARWGQRLERIAKPLEIFDSDMHRCGPLNKLRSADYESFDCLLQHDREYREACCCHSCGSLANQ